MKNSQLFHYYYLSVIHDLIWNLQVYAFLQYLNENMYPEEEKYYAKVPNIITIFNSRDLIETREIWLGN